MAADITAAASAGKMQEYRLTENPAYEHGCCCAVADLESMQGLIPAALPEQKTRKLYNKHTRANYFYAWAGKAVYADAVTCLLCGKFGGEPAGKDCHLNTARGQPLCKVVYALFKSSDEWIEIA